MDAATGEPLLRLGRTGEALRARSVQRHRRPVSRRAERTGHRERLHELETRNALRLKRLRDEIDDRQLAASMSMLEADLASGRLIRGRVDWPSVFAGAERLSAAMTAGIGVRAIDLLHVAVAHHRAASGLVSLDRRQCSAGPCHRTRGGRALNSTFSGHGICARRPPVLAHPPLSRIAPDRAPVDPADFADARIRETWLHD